MRYFRRLVARSATAQPRLQARGAAPFAERDVRIEELDADVLVPAREPARTAPLAPPLPERALPGATPAEAAPAPTARRAAEEAGQRPSAEGSADDAPRRAAADAQRVRRVQRVSRIVERTRLPAPPRDELPASASDDAPLVASVNEAPPLRERLRRPRRADPIVREPPRVTELVGPEPSSTTVVNVAIGRIEVRAAASAAASPARPEPFRPRLTLEAHLARESGSR